MEHVIDAKGKAVGRVASLAASLLRGKNSPQFERHKNPTDSSVKIVNAALAKISPKKAREKIYKRYTGYPSGLLETRMEELIEKKGHQEVFRKAIQGMLPRNKLRKELMQRLIVSN